MKLNLFRALGAILRLSLFVCLLATPLSYAAAALQEVRYVAVIDAGSSGSRLFLYSVHPTDSFLELRTADLPEATVRPGLSSYSDKQGRFSTQTAGDSLRPLLMRLEDYLNRNSILKAQVPLYVLATAGMRRIDRQDPETSVAIYESVRRAILAEGYSLGQVAVADVPGQKVRAAIGTLPGQLEALYGWEDVNFLKGNFATKQRTQGIVEMGGASLQVVYVVSPSFKNSNVLKRTINGVEYSVFALSYLDAGVDEIVRSIGSQLPLANPCFVRGSPRVLPPAQPIDDDFNLAECAQRLTKALEPLWSQNIPNPTDSNIEKNTFIGIGAIATKLARWNTSPNTLPVAGTSDIGRLGAAIQNACVKNDWSSLLSWFNGPQEFALNLCAQSVYIQNFLFGSDLAGGQKELMSLRLSERQLVSMETISNESTTWTRGFIVDLMGTTTASP